ncbi:site-specific integrase [Flagellimonas taeanensis]|uniref:site-specific integrase n=1 Tax=Flagellimonas taeanensis TaxID=1005926 RepID=UPI000E67E661|nr:site-specific integrase [Allomuricauda taeanensis]RIV50906.1 site-specific integrase [Allomuricauda taeanensis]
MEATADIYLDPRKKADGKCSVKIKVTHKRNRKYFSTGIDLFPDEFEKVMTAKRRTREEKNIHTKLEVFKSKANNVIEGMKVFTFANFKEGYYESRDINNDVSFAFDKRIEELRENGKIGTAVTYECAKNSLSDYSPKLTFAEITPTWLRKYEKHMLDKGRSITTVSMYLRSLRAIFNNQNIDKSIYPFGRGKGKYSIPTGRNVKKALTLEEVAKIYNYEPKNDVQAMARDYWMFLYLCNGMNVKDFCLLKWDNIEGDILYYERAKTTTTERDKKGIRIALKPESKSIIRKWGNPSLNKSDFIFPHLEASMTLERQRRIYQDLTKQINKYIQVIAKELEIHHHVTTYSARHSFATVLKRSGANIAMISDLLGHSDLSVTQNYLDSFEDDQIQEQTNVLTTGFKKAN